MALWSQSNPTEQNVGGLDRTARLVIGGLLILAAILIYIDFRAFGIAAADIAVVVGAILLTTGVTQKCPINQAAGINTLRR